MKIYIFLLVVFIILFSCDTNENITTTLTINNLSDYPLLNVEYASVNYGLIKSGDDIEKVVSDGTKYIFFYLQTTSIGILRCRTEPVTCTENLKNEILITNNTIITITVSEKTDTLRNICNEFGVSGNIYKIGDIGPGGGTIFFASGGQYKEVSGDLGSYIYNDAISIAGGYNGGGYNNWYLPDKGELQSIYENLFNKYSTSNYWSSTMKYASGVGVEYLYFGDGRWRSTSYNNGITSISAKTLAVRRFN